ncbi:MAG: MmgE/PrpD family protein, partial [Lachnospiraceae bacterium]|nr:MmgE/PrpD family protein [Lachnospiraceae bacterium]
VPKKRPANVTVIMKDGTSFSEQVDYALGEPENPMSVEDFMEKFYDLCAYGGKDRSEAGQVAEKILHGTGSVRELIALLR